MLYVHPNVLLYTGKMCLFFVCLFFLAGIGGLVDNVHA